MDTIEVKLPSGKVAVVRNYTTRGDDEASERLLYTGVETDQEVGGDSTRIKFPMVNFMAAQRSYVYRLTQSVDGADPDFENMRTSDYEALEKAVDQIVEDNSPKVKEARKASKNATNAK